MCQLIFCLVLDKYESISIKIGRHVREETLNKTMKRMPTSPKTCASTTFGNLKWQIEPSIQYLHVHFNESLNTTKRLAVKRVVSHISFTSYAQNVCLQHEHKHVDVGATSPTTSSMNSRFRLFTRFWCVVLVRRHLKSLYTLEADISSMYCEDHVVYYTFDDFWHNYCQSCLCPFDDLLKCMWVLRWQLNLSPQIFQVK